MSQTVAKKTRSDGEFESAENSPVTWKKWA